MILLEKEEKRYHQIESLEEELDIVTESEATLKKEARSLKFEVNYLKIRNKQLRQLIIRSNTADAALNK